MSIRLKLATAVFVFFLNACAVNGGTGALSLNVDSREGIAEVRVDGQSVVVSDEVVGIIEEEGSAELIEDKRIKCRRTIRTGTHMVSRVCMTVAEWNEKREQAQDRMHELYRQTNRACAVRRNNQTDGLESMRC